MEVDIPIGRCNNMSNVQDRKARDKGDEGGCPLREGVLAPMSSLTES